MFHKPRFIAVEGLDGSGKTTQLEKIHTWLVDHGQDVVVTREPGGTEVAEMLRSVLLDPHLKEPLDPVTELLMVFAARRQHIKQKIEPALEEGKWVLSDRFVDSSYAYQKVPNGLSDMLWGTLMNEVVGDCEPDIILFYDLPDAVAAERLQKRPGKTDRMDQQAVDFHRTVANALRSRLSDTRHHEINADSDIDTVHQRTIDMLETILAPPVVNDTTHFICLGCMHGKPASAFPIDSPVHHANGNPHVLGCCSKCSDLDAMWHQRSATPPQPDVRPSRLKRFLARLIK